jgi:hypothetical protein
MVRVYLECVLKVIYRSTYIGIVFGSLIFETSKLNPSTSKSSVITTSTLLRQLIFRYEDSVRNPQPYNRWKAENLSFLHVLLVWGITLTSLLIKKHQR